METTFQQNVMNFSQSVPIISSAALTPLSGFFQN